MSTAAPARRRVGAGLALVVIAGLGGGGCGDEPTGTPVTETGSGAIPAEMASVAADAERVAPALESWSRDHGYATTLEEAKQALADAGLELTPPNVVGGYRYDPDAVEFVLCIQTPTGVYASFDTQPMVLFKTGASTGCDDF